MSAPAGRDADRLFHREWLGLAQPIEGLVFSIPVLSEAQIAPAGRAAITTELRAHLLSADGDAPRALADVRAFFADFLGYGAPGMLVDRDALPDTLSFFAPESGQELRPTFALARGPFGDAVDDPFATFDAPASETSEPAAPAEIAPATQSPYVALVWDLGAEFLDLDAPEEVTGPWRYPPTTKLDRLLRHVGVPVGFITNRRELRVVHAPAGEATSHLTFRMDDLAEASGRPLVLALELLFHARRTYTASARHTFEGLLAESRRRQADVTGALADQVFEAVERLVLGFEAAAAREGPEAVDWLREAQEAGQVYEGALEVILRLVFLLYAEDRSLLPVDHPVYAAHLSVLALYERLTADAGAHPESMNRRFGAYGALISLFRAVYFGVRHGTLVLPARRGRLFDPSAFPFLEGGLPGWTAAVNDGVARAGVRLPSVDDATLHEVLHRLIVLGGQRLSYRDLSVEQIGAVYESLMGYRALRVIGPAVRLGPNGHWVETAELLASKGIALEEILHDRAGLSATAQKRVAALLAERAKKALDDDALLEGLLAFAPGNKAERPRHRARGGQLVLQPTVSRRSTGSHYTPRQLSERVVRRTLGPLLACLGPAPTAERILELKVCDPAMGSGAFLVEACRFLAEAVVAAWQRSGEHAAILEAHGDPALFAKRLVAQRCLYGVDKNPAAVELAKLSLWLETLSGDRSFTFLDHVLRHGDSLVGLDLAQIRAFHWAPERQLTTVGPLVDRVLDEVKSHRDKIQGLANDETDAAQDDKRRYLELSDLAMATVKLVADACVGAFFAHDKPRAREDERLRRLRVVEAFLGGDETQRPALHAWADDIRARHAPFHWHLELPEVFFLDRPDPLEDEHVNHAALMDAFVGNPPFMGVHGVAGTLGDSYVQWLHETVPGDRGNRGRCDLSAYFFRRAAVLLGSHGTMGFIATNSISEGDTRSIGLKHLVARENFAIYDGTRALKWSGDADVIVSVVLLAKGRARERLPALRLDEEVVPAISSRLRATPERPDPTELNANSGCSFQGSIVLGMGFTMTADERDSLVSKNQKNTERIFAYLGGQEVNTSPTQSHDRYVINFGHMPLEEAECWPDLMRILRERVQPEREALHGRNAWNRDVARRWWQFASPRVEGAAAIAKLGRCLVTARVTKHLCFSFQPTDRVLNEKLYVFPLPSLTSFAVLQSRIHEPWARLISSVFGSSSIGAVLNYSASDCFGTFPFPEPDPRAVIPALEVAGQRLYDARAAHMIARNEGLTTTYNHLKNPACDDPAILELRLLHEAMDRAVLDAYGWTHLPVPPFCPITPAEHKALETFKEQVIDHLFVLNATRAAEEARLGAAKAAKPGASAKGAAKPTKAAAKKKRGAGQGKLPGT